MHEGRLCGGTKAARFQRDRADCAEGRAVPGAGSHCRALAAGTWFRLTPFSNSALSQLEKEC